MKIHIIKTITALIFVGFIAIPSFVGAQVPNTDGGDTGGADSTSSASAPTTDGGDIGGTDSNEDSSSAAPTTDGGDTGGADSNANGSGFTPDTDGGNTGGTDSNNNSSGFTPETDGGNTGGVDSGSTSNNNGGSSNGDDDNNGSSGSRRSSSSRNVVTSASSSPVVITIKNCSYINDYLKLGGSNKASEVSKLQLFLKNIEKLNVDVNGTFDQKTLDAVKAFQTKYVQEIMLPWGVTTPTGQVFYTTKKKINEVVCNTKLTLTAEQIAQIEAYRKGLADGTIQVDANGTPVNATGTIPLSPEVGSGDESSQTAAVGSFAGKIWGFIKWIFGY